MLNREGDPMGGLIYFIGLIVVVIHPVHFRLALKNRWGWLQDENLRRRG
jgi:hypothetical protein